MKRLFAIIICALLCLSFAQTSFAADATSLHFDDDGEFKMLLIADVQDIHIMNTATKILFNAVLDETDTDLVIFLGDQLHAPVIGSNEKKTKEAIDNIARMVEDRGIPFAVVFGNHDDEGGVSKETQLAWYQSHKGCLAIEGEEMTGCGNYCLPIFSSDGTKKLVNLWFFDSNTYPEDGQGKYDRVHQDQLDWYLRESKLLTEENGGVPIPGYAFQHIIVPEIYDALEQVPAAEKKQPGVVKGFGNHSDRYYKLPDTAKAGSLGEGPCPPDVNGGQFEAWLSAGDIKAAFFGHDHVNDFVVPYKGIDLVNTNGIGFYVYGAGDEHGARLVTIREDSPEQYETRMLYYRDIVGDKLPIGLSPTTGAVIERLIIKAMLAILVIADIVYLIIHQRKKARK